MRVPVGWVGLDANIGGSGFSGAWLGDENASDQPSRRINWGAIAGLAISFVISGGFWEGSEN